MVKTQIIILLYIHGGSVLFLPPNPLPMIIYAYEYERTAEYQQYSANSRGILQHIGQVAYARYIQIKADHKALNFALAFIGVTFLAVILC